MKKVYLQYWEESERGWGIRPDGCSFHLTLGDRDKYVKSVYENRDGDSIPDEYDRVVGEPILSEVSDKIYEEISSSDGNLRIPQQSLTNLKRIGDINLIMDYVCLN